MRDNIADRIVAVLEAVYVNNTCSFTVEARQRGVSVEQLAAAAIAEMVRLEAEETADELTR